MDLIKRYLASVLYAIQFQIIKDMQASLLNSQHFKSDISEITDVWSLHSKHKTQSEIINYAWKTYTITSPSAYIYIPHKPGWKICNISAVQIDMVASIRAVVFAIKADSVRMIGH